MFGALELALASATKKRFNEDVDIRAQIDRATGEFSFFRRWEVVQRRGYRGPGASSTSCTRRRRSTPSSRWANSSRSRSRACEVGRIGAQTAKQVILQKIRDAEREQILNDFLARKEHLVTGVIKRMERGNAIIESGRLEAMLPRDQMIPKENLRVGDRVRALHLEDRPGEPRARSSCSRAPRPNSWCKLFELEVPELEDGLLEIKAAARDPGLARQDRGAFQGPPHRSRSAPASACAARACRP